MEEIYTTWGTAMVAFVQQFRTPFFDELFTNLTLLGEMPILVLAMAGAFALNRQARWVAGAMLLAFLTASVINAELKALFDVSRPSSLDVWTVEDSTSSATPSAHTMIASAVWLTLAFVGRLPAGWRVAFVAIPVLVGMTRVYLGMHYPGDVLLGLALGAAIAATLWVVCRLLADIVRPLVASRSGQQVSRAGYLPSGA